MKMSKDFRKIRITAKTLVAAIDITREVLIAARILGPDVDVPIDRAQAELGSGGYLPSHGIEAIHWYKSIGQLYIRFTRNDKGKAAYRRLMAVVTALED